MVHVLPVLVALGSSKFSQIHIVHISTLYCYSYSPYFATVIFVNSVHTTVYCVSVRTGSIPNRSIPVTVTKPWL